MKLAEALQERADINSRLSKLYQSDQLQHSRRWQDSDRNDRRKRRAER